MSDSERSRPRWAGLVAHVVWEAVLLLLVVVAAVCVLVFTDLRLEQAFWSSLAGLGLLATGFALSVRTATPNLAVVAIAALSGVVFAKLLAADWPALLAGGVVLLLMLITGLVLGVITGLTSAPAWAVSLGGLAIVQAIALAVADSRGVIIPAVHRPGSLAAVLWMLLFVGGSVAGGALFLLPRVRDLLCANRTNADPALWKATRLLGAVAGFTGSSIIAALSGMAISLHVGGAFPTGDNSRLVLVIGAVLLGGVSVFGRRGGVAGTVLATTLLILIHMGLLAAGAPAWATFGVPPALAVMLGVGVSWLFEKVAGAESPT